MIRKIRKSEIPNCVEVIRNSFYDMPFMKRKRWGVRG